MLARRGQSDTVLNRHRWELTPSSLEYPHITSQHSHPMILRFSLVVPSGLKLKSTTLILQLTILQIFSQTVRGVKALISRVRPTTRLLPLSYHLSIALLMSCSYKKVTRITEKDNLMHLEFQPTPVT
jgi:hypothetical protein